VGIRGYSVRLAYAKFTSGLSRNYHCRSWHHRLKEEGGGREDGMEGWRVDVIGAMRRERSMGRGKGQPESERRELTAYLETGERRIPRSLSAV